MKKRDPTRISRSNARCLRPIGAIEQSVLVGAGAGAGAGEYRCNNRVPRT